VLELLPIKTLSPPHVASRVSVRDVADVPLIDLLLIDLLLTTR
jgi:hypothetical protein